MAGAVARREQHLEVEPGRVDRLACHEVSVDLRVDGVDGEMQVEVGYGFDLLAVVGIVVAGHRQHPEAAVSVLAVELLCLVGSVEGLAPGVLARPGVVPAGGPVNATPAHLVDIMATFVEIAGADYPESIRGETVGAMDGVSLLPALRKGTVARTEPMFFEWRRGLAVIDGRWKLVLQEVRPQDEESGLWAFSSREWELYDLSKDKTEINNLADKHPKKLEELKAKFEAWWAGVEPGVVYPDK